MSVTLFPGHTYAVDGDITHVNLTALMGNATLAGIARGDLGSGFYGITKSASEPTDLMPGELWWDTVNKYHMTKAGGFTFAIGGPMFSIVLPYYDNNPSSPSHGKLVAGEAVMVNTLIDDACMIAHGSQNVKVAGIALAAAQDGSQVAIAMAGIVDVLFAFGVDAGEFAYTSISGRSTGQISYDEGAFGVILETIGSAGMARVLLNAPKG